MDACDICDEVAAAYNSGVEHTKRQPLTEAEINDIERDGEFWDDHSPLDFVRAIEAAHGIGEKT
jgi:hypothetical protein